MRVIKPGDLVSYSYGDDDAPRKRWGIVAGEEWSDPFVKVLVPKRYVLVFWSTGRVYGMETCVLRHEVTT